MTRPSSAAPAAVRRCQPASVSRPDGRSLASARRSARNGTARLARAVHGVAQSVAQSAEPLPPISVNIARSARVSRVIWHFPENRLRFIPESGHVRCNSVCPLCANSGHALRQGSKVLAKAGVSRARSATPGQSLFALSCIAACSFLISAGDSCGRSTLIVSLLSLAVSRNGGV